MHNGKIEDKGAFPNDWTRFGDEILRSYLVATKDDKNFGYVWTMYCPPAIVAKTLQKMNFKDAMILDIHPVIAGIALNPRRNKSDFNFTRKTVYDFVPNEYKIVKNLRDRISLSLTEKIKGPIQDDHYVAIENGVMEHDFFSVFMKY